MRSRIWGEERKKTCPAVLYENRAVADLGKRALSATYSGGPSVVLNFHFGRPKKKNSSGFKKWKEKRREKKKRKKSSAFRPVIPLGPFDQVACVTFFFGGGSNFDAGGPENIFYGGPVSSCRHC